MSTVQQQALPRRSEIIDYIKGRLGEDLGSLYEEAIRSSVSTGSYDHDWRQGPPYPRVETYLRVLYEDWMRKQGDIRPILARVVHLLNFGSEHEKKQLRTLLKLDLPASQKD